MKVGGEPLDPEREYTIASAHTRFQNNPLFGAMRVRDTGKVFVEELIAHLKENSPIDSKLDDRINLSNRF
jgi:hypothetical protein